MFENVDVMFCWDGVVEFGNCVIDDIGNIGGVGYEFFGLIWVGGGEVEVDIVVVDMVEIEYYCVWIGLCYVCIVVFDEFSYMGYWDGDIMFDWVVIGVFCFGNVFV